MAYQSEAALEQQFIEQLNKQEYRSVSISDYDALVENFKISKFDLNLLIPRNLTHH